MKNPTAKAYKLRSAPDLVLSYCPHLHPTPLLFHLDILGVLMQACGGNSGSLVCLLFSLMVENKMVQSDNVFDHPQYSIPWDWHLDWSLPLTSISYQMKHQLLHGVACWKAELAPRSIQPIFLLLLCVYVFLCMHMCAHRCICTYVHGCGRQKLMSDALIDHCVCV